MLRTKWRQNATLWAAQAFVNFFRTVFRIREATIPKHKRTRLHQLRQKLEAMDRDRDILMARVKTEKGWGKFDALDQFMERHADPRTLESRKPHQERMQRIRQESNELQAIRQRAGEDWGAAVLDHQEYVKDHPESHAGYSYLGGALKKAGNLNGSLSAYREAVRLSDDSSVASGSNRINIADVLHAQGESDAAIAELRSLVDAQGTQSEIIIGVAWNQLGDYLREAGDRKAALRAWKQAVKWDSSPQRLIGKKAREKVRANR